MIIGFSADNKIFATLSHDTGYSPGTYTIKALISFSLAESVLTMTRPFELQRIIVYDD